MGWALSWGGFDAIFFPAVYTFAPLFRRVPTLVTFHDAIAETHPDLVFAGSRTRLFWRIKTWLARKQADRVVTVSESARGDVAKAFGIPEAEIPVIPEAPASHFKPLEDHSVVAAVLAAYGVPLGRPLILSVGGISPHKNLGGVFRALARLDAVAHLVIVGDHLQDSFLGCFQELREECDRLGLSERVTFTGFVPDEQLAVFYNASRLLVLASFAEGFGLPAVEAMACGLPVAASRRGSLPEILGDAALFFDPTDEGEMAASLKSLLEDADLRARLAAAGLERAGRLSWKEAARRAVRLIEETARSR
jgi:glycosyltransferase involved in cell wall biosynthesis